MAAQAGQAIIVSIKDNAGTPAYQVIGGMRARRVAFNAESVDVTHAESSGRWRTFLDTAGVQSMTISGDGVFIDDTAVNEMNEVFLAGQLRDFKFEVPGLGNYVAQCKITALELAGDFNKEVTFSATFESGGAIVFT